MRARESAPQRETRTGTAGRGTHAPAAPADRDASHDHNGHPARHSGSGPDAWIRELAEAAPPLTPAQRHALALLLDGQAGACPASPAPRCRASGHNRSRGLAGKNARNQSAVLMAVCPSAGPGP